MEYNKLGHYCTITSSKRIFAHQYVTSGIPFYRSREIIEKNNGETISEPLYISVDAFNLIREKFGVPQAGDILLTSVGTLGVPYLVKDETFYFKDGNLTWMKDFSADLVPEYLYYWLSSSFGKQSLVQLAIGSSQPALTIEILKKYKIPLLSAPIQRRIASILSAYDNLIENNNRRIRLLEQMAENLYKEWFVRFRFPGHKKIEIENGVPTIWKRGKLRDLAIEVDKPEKANNRNKYNHYLPIDKLPMRSMALQEEDLIDNAESSLIAFKRGDILFGAMRPYYHKVILAPFDGLTRTTCFVLNAREPIYRFFLYMLMFQKSTIDFASTVAVGSTMPYDRWKDLSRMNIIIPDLETIDRFNSIICPIINRILENYQTNQNLTRQRDLLLPRLMSGKLEVNA